MVIFFNKLIFTLKVLGYFTNIIFSVILQKQPPSSLSPPLNSLLATVYQNLKYDSYHYCRQCFDAVGWVAGRASGL